MARDENYSKGQLCQTMYVKLHAGSAQYRVFSGGKPILASFPCRAVRCLGKVHSRLGGLMREGACFEDGSGIRLVRKDHSGNANGDGDGNVGEEAQTYKVIRN